MRGAGQDNLLPDGVPIGTLGRLAKKAGLTGELGYTPFVGRPTCLPYNVRVTTWERCNWSRRSTVDTLGQDDQETAVFYVDLLVGWGALLGEPYTRQLHGKLRELRFHLSRETMIASGRRIILLTVFKKQRMREAGEIERAMRAMGRCIAEAHTADEE
ncbi:hypothetical protein ACFWY5_11380 [Nonomuraea sp. NPDC059007]|uniref:hypothetical protein n=1 Tax=Nonomuraea sp. NPDC059007 TaxID=3346692 RepID=UPI0036B1BBD5